MIIVRLIGGLGNQMFQYAAGRSLAKRNNAVLKLDVSSYAEYYKLRKFSLNAFDIKATFASQSEIYKLTLRPKGVLRKICNRLFNVKYSRPPSLIKEKHFHYDPRFLTLPDNVYLEGYWQSERYFENVHQELKREFVFKTPQSDLDRTLTENITSTNSVSVHVRRGDYVNNPEIRKMLHLLDRDYYRKSLDYFSQHLKDPVFVVFSDDKAWVKENFRFPYDMIFVEHNDESKCIEDLRLMSQCKHHVIANSSFSWWGAWLGSEPGKKIIGPGKWFVDSRYNVKDLLPEDWVVL